MTINIDRVDMRPANQIGNCINAYLITRNRADLDPIRTLMDQVRAGTCHDTRLAAYGRICGTDLTDDEAAYALDMSAEEVRLIRRATTALITDTPQAAQIRAETRALMAQAA